MVSDHYCATIIQILIINRCFPQISNSAMGWYQEAIRRVYTYFPAYPAVKTGHIATLNPYGQGRLPSNPFRNPETGSNLKSYVVPLWNAPLMYLMATELWIDSRLKHSEQHKPTHCHYVKHESILFLQVVSGQGFVSRGIWVLHTSLQPSAHKDAWHSPQAAFDVFDVE